MRSYRINMIPCLAPGLTEQNYWTLGGVRFTLRSSHDRQGAVGVMTMQGQYRVGEKDAALHYLTEQTGRKVEVIGPVRG